MSIGNGEHTNDELAKSIFLDALEIASDQERLAYLDRRCGSDHQLRSEVETLLRHEQRLGDYLDRPALDLGATGDFTEPTITEGPGTVIGPFKLMEQIGEGGMGVVYVAEQTKPVRRKVALKIIKPGMDTKQVIARFEAERQALAMMDHPNIAKVLDGGATDSGRPYFVMELVRGTPITLYCDQETLSIRDRLELFVQVCRAVQHAHQKGIIHRDLKPSNILVTLHDGVPVPKVIDFGVAKAAGQSLTDKTVYTAFTQLVGTPLYMSPEQVELSGLDIDTRSDIYGLGVLLYELLTGTTPFDAETLRNAAFDEMRRIIREQEPQSPSTRLSSLGETLTTVSARRKADPRKLGPSLRGELDWIVMKALEKDRRRRYETAIDFAADVARYLADQPVEACPPSAWYRIGKVARRNRVALLTTALVAMALVLGTAVSTWQAFRAMRAERRALADRGRAETAEKAARVEAEKASAINDFLINDLLTGGEHETNPLPDNVKFQEVLDRAADKLQERFHDQPEVASASRMTLAHTYENLGLYAKAERHAQAALEIEQRVHGPEAAGTFHALETLGRMRNYLGQHSEAIELLQQATEGLRRTLGPDHPDTLASRHALAEAYNAAGRTAEAIALAEETIKLKEKRLGAHHRDTLASRGNLAGYYKSAGRMSDAIALLESTLKLKEAELGPDHPRTLTGRTNLAFTYLQAGRFDESITLGEATVKMWESKYGPDHFNTLICRDNLARSYLAAGRAAEAIKSTVPTLKTNESKLGPDHEDTLACRNILAQAYQAAGRVTEALGLFEETLKRCKAKFGSSHIGTLEIMNNLAAAYLVAHRWAEAETLARQRLALVPKQNSSGWTRFYTMSQLGGALLGQKKYAEAEPLLMAGYEGLKEREAKIPAVRRHCLIEATERLVQLYEETGKKDKAAEWRAKQAVTKSAGPAQTKND